MTKKHIYLTGILTYIFFIWISLAILLWLLQFSLIVFGFWVLTLGLFLYPYVFKLRKYRWPQFPALALTWVSFVVLVALMYLVLDLAVAKEKNLAEQLLLAEKQVKTGLPPPGLFFRSQAKPLSKAEIILSQQLVNFRNQTQTWSTKMPHTIFQLVALAVMIGFGLAGTERGKRFLIRCLPNAWLEKAMFGWSRIGSELGQYAGVAVVQITITFAMVGFALYLLKIPYFFTWAVLAAFASLIPFYLGLILGIIPPILTVYLSNMPIIEVGGILITFAVLNLFLRLVTLRQPEVNQLQPRFYELPFLLALGWLVAQLWGVLLAVPVAIGLKIIRKQVLHLVPNLFRAKKR